MNNKRLGARFEREMCEKMSKAGYWVHFISPDRSGAQPFDIIGTRYGIAFAIDCKTSSKRLFPLTRLEDNQIMAFEKWMECGNSVPCVAVKFEDHIYLVPYTDLKNKKIVDLADYGEFDNDSGSGSSNSDT